jgi:hypothetical protein
MGAIARQAGPGGAPRESFGVVGSSESIEATLLRALAAGRWLTRFRLQGPVHPFVGSVLLGMTRLDA